MNNNEQPVRVSENIFADLGIEDAEEELQKAQLAHAIRAIIQANGLTQEEAARKMGTSQPKVSQIMGGKLAGFSSDRLLHYVRSLECDIEIRITRRPADRERSITHIICTI